MSIVYPDLQDRIKQIQKARNLRNEDASKLSGIPLGTYNKAIADGVMGRKVRRKVLAWIEKNNKFLEEL